VRLSLSLGAGLPAIEGDPSQIQQVVMNLVINGAEALGPEQGAVEVRTLARYAEPGELAGGVTRPIAPAGKYVVLEVHDTGVGMDEETRARIFDPFFTTKFAGRGLGCPPSSESSVPTTVHSSWKAALAPALLSASFFRARPPANRPSRGIECRTSRAKFPHRGDEDTRCDGRNRCE
jgi:hypothetical protein